MFMQSGVTIRADIMHPHRRRDDARHLSAFAIRIPVGKRSEEITKADAATPFREQRADFVGKYLVYDLERTSNRARRARRAERTGRIASIRLFVHSVYRSSFLGCSIFNQTLMS